MEMILIDKLVFSMLLWSEMGAANRFVCITINFTKLDIKITFPTIPIPGLLQGSTTKVALFL